MIKKRAKKLKRQISIKKLWAEANMLGDWAAQLTMSVIKLKKKIKKLEEK